LPRRKRRRSCGSGPLIRLIPRLSMSPMKPPMNSASRRAARPPSWWRLPMSWLQWS